jgi:hypothetical protein
MTVCCTNGKARIYYKEAYDKGVAIKKHSEIKWTTVKGIPPYSWSYEPIPGSGDGIPYRCDSYSTNSSNQGEQYRLVNFTGPITFLYYVWMKYIGYPIYRFVDMGIYSSNTVTKTDSWGLTIGYIQVSIGDSPTPVNIAEHFFNGGVGSVFTITSYTITRRDELPPGQGEKHSFTLYDQAGELISFECDICPQVRVLGYEFPYYESYIDVELKNYSLSSLLFKDCFDILRNQGGYSKVQRTSWKAVFTPLPVQVIDIVLSLEEKEGLPLPQIRVVCCETGECDKECPPNTCAVDCHGTRCCYDRDGRLVRSIQL